jgi:uncharacterized protein
VKLSLQNGAAMSSRWSFRIAGEEAHVPTMLAAMALGTAGGFGAQALGMPLPMLLGSLLAVSAAAILGFRPTGRVLGIPLPLRAGFVPVIGVSIGTAFTPGILGKPRAGGQASWRFFSTSRSPTS